MKELKLIKSNLANFLEILKAKKRNDGEVWTQPSGRKVTKKNGKIVPVSEGKKQPNEKKEKKGSSKPQNQKLKETKEKLAKMLDKINKQKEMIESKIKNIDKQLKGKSGDKGKSTPTPQQERAIEELSNFLERDEYNLKLINQKLKKTKNKEQRAKLEEYKKEHEESIASLKQELSKNPSDIDYVPDSDVSSIQGFVENRGSREEYEEEFKDFINSLK